MFRDNPNDGFAKSIYFEDNSTVSQLRGAPLTLTSNLEDINRTQTDFNQ